MHRPITGRLVIATHNPGKLVEMRELLAPHGVEAISAGDLGLGEPEETGERFPPMHESRPLAAAQSAQLPAFAERFRTGGRRARRRARDFLRTLGRTK